MLVICGALKSVGSLYTQETIVCVKSGDLHRGDFVSDVLEQDTGATVCQVSNAEASHFTPYTDVSQLQQQLMTKPSLR